MKRQPHLTRAFTLMEILVVVLVLILLMCVLLPRLVQSKRSSQLTGCMANLKQVMLAELLWINDNEKRRLSWQYSTNEKGTLEYLERGGISPHLKAVTNEIMSPRILTCPSDNRAVAKDFSALADSNLSYFMNMDAWIGGRSGGIAPREKLVQVIIFGDRNVTNSTGPKSGIITLTEMNYKSLNWDSRLHNPTRKPSQTLIGNIAYGDGSAATAKATNLHEALEYELFLDSTNRLAVP